MPDIFGKNQDDYKHLAAMDEQQRADYNAYNLEMRGAFAQPHNFNGLEQGVPQEYQRAADDAQAVGFLTNNLLAIQAAVDEVLFTAYRLPMFVSINTTIPEGASSYGFRVTQRTGRAQRITDDGPDAPSATVSQGLVTKSMDLYGLDGRWSLDELRGAMFAGIPLDTETVDAATVGTLEEMERVALTGGDYGNQGLLNLPTDDVSHSTSSQTFAEMSPVKIRSLINGEMNKLIDNTKETLGRNISTGMTVYLPGLQYDLLTTAYIGDNADKTLMRAISEDNPWTHFTGNPISFERVLELADYGTTGRMIVGLKHPRVAELGVSIMPRVIMVRNEGRYFKALVEAKFSELFVRRPKTLYYVDGI